MNIAASIRKTHPEAMGRVYRRVVLERIAAQWGIPIDEIKGPSRERVVAHCRRAVAIACRANGATWMEIAQLLNKHPSTIREMLGAKPLTSTRKTKPPVDA